MKSGRFFSLLGIGIIGACGPRVSPETSDAESGSTSAAESTTTTSPSVDSGSETGSPEELPCETFDSQSCPDQCMVIETGFGSGCNVEQASPACVTPGDPLPDGIQSTFYGLIDGEMRWLVVGQPCGGDPPPNVPAGWSECTGAPGEPEPCTCLCGTNGCPSVVMTELLESCFDRLCGELVPHGLGRLPSEYDLCVLTALRDRVPGLVEMRLEQFVVADYRAHLDGGEQVQFTKRSASGVCSSPLQGQWEHVESCTLQPPSFFDDCLTAEGPDLQSCLAGVSWVTDCQPAAPTCP